MPHPFGYENDNRTRIIIILELSTNLNLSNLFPGISLPPKLLTVLLLMIKFAVIQYAVGVDDNKGRIETVISPVWNKKQVARSVCGLDPFHLYNLILSFSSPVYICSGIIELFQIRSLLSLNYTRCL